MPQLTTYISNDSLERIEVSPDSLLLDNANPRFYGEEINMKLMEEYPIEDPRLQEYLRQQIYNKYNVKDLISSIAEIGFLKLDPIIVVETSGRYKVIEGNRRLTAIKTILGDLKRKTLSIPREVEDSLNRIEVVKLNDDDDSTAWMLQGIRHVSGVRDWGPYQKAELIKALYDKKEMSFKQIGSVIGLSPQRVSTILNGYMGILQMMADAEWSAKANPDLFSHFEQAYVRGPLRDWLGWDKIQRRYTNEHNLKHFFKWITSADEETARPILKSKDVRDILPAVIEHDEARSLFVEGEINLDEAYSLATAGNSNTSNVTAAATEFYSSLKSINSSFGIGAAEKQTLEKILNKLKKLLKK